MPKCDKITNLLQLLEKRKAELREKALGDLEFASIKESEVFTEAVK